MGKYIRTMAESLSMVHEVTNMDLMRKAAGGAMQTLKMKDGKVQMDSFTASAIMQIYDKVNDKNKKTMENMLKTGRRADIMKLQKFAMSKINAEYVPEELDEQLEEKIDPADVDDDATEDDIKSADKNIMMQMRKVQSLRGRYAVEFMDGKKVKVDPKIAMAVQDKYMKMRRPAEKEMFQSKVARSYKDMLSALKESLEEELAKIKGNTPAADGRRAATQDDIDRAEKKGDEKLVKKLKEKPADFIRLTFNSPADVKKAKKWMDQNLPGANQGFTGMDASGKDIEFEGVDDAEDLMAKLKKAGFRFKMDYREEVELDEMKSGNYALAVKGKFVAVGSKADMMKMKKQKAREIYMSPGAKVGDKAEEVELDEALPSHLKKFFDKDGNPKSKEGMAAWERIAKSKGFKKYTDKQIKMAIGVAFDKRYVQGNMTGATKTIEKIAKGLSEIQPVRDALRRANEERVAEQLARIRGNTPADQGRRAATKDDLEDAEKKGDKKLIKKLKEETILERIDRKLKERRNG